MKKIVFVLLLALTGFFNIDVSSVKAATYSVDPTSSFDGGDRRWSTRKIAMVPYEAEMTDVALSLCQSFIPTRTTMANYLDALVYGTAQPEDYRMTIIGNVANEIDQPTNPIFSETISPDDVVFTPTSLATMPGTGVNDLPMTRFYNSSGKSINLTAGQKYWLCLTSNDYTSGEIMVWYSGNSWSGGKARAGNSPYAEFSKEGFVTDSEDFGFKAYTQEAEIIQPPVQEPDSTPATPNSTPTTPAASTPLPTGVTAGSGAAPAAPTTSIKAPTGLTAADVAADQGGSLKLDWTASTTADIDGYKVFRSLEENKGFAEIARTEKTFITYTDNQAAIGQKYYYLVRAYKTTKESASSNTVNGISADNTAPASPRNFTYTKNALDYTLAWDKNTEADIAGYSLSITDGSGQVLETIEIAKELNAYELIVADYQKLATEGAYGFSLIAKDISGNLSEKSIATEKQAEKVSDVQTATVANDNNANKSNHLIWYIAVSVVLLLLAGGALYWFKFRKNTTLLN